MQRSQRRLTLQLAPGILAFLVAALSVADMFIPRPYDGVILEADVPGVRIVLRADSGFSVPAMYEACERLEIDYTIGIGMNPTLKKWSDSLLSHCVEEFERTGEPQRKFCAFWYKADSWPAQRWSPVRIEFVACLLPASVWRLLLKKPER